MSLSPPSQVGERPWRIFWSLWLLSGLPPDHGHHIGTRARRRSGPRRHSSASITTSGTRSWARNAYAAGRRRTWRRTLGASLDFPT